MPRRERPSGEDALAEFRRQREERRARRGEYSMSASREQRFASRRGEEQSADAGKPRATPAGALNFRQLINIFLAVGVEQKTAADIIESNSAIAGLTEARADVFKQVLRDSLSVLSSEGVPQNVFESRLEEHAAAGKLDAVRVRTNLCKVCRDAAAIKVSYPEVMVRYFRREQRFRGELVEGDWLCKGCYGSWYGDNLDFVKELQQAEEEARQKLIAEEMAALDEEGGSDDDSGDDSDEEDKEGQVQKELFLKTIVYPLFIVATSMEESAMQHRKFLTRQVTVGKVRLIQIPAALRYLRKHTVVDEDDFEHAVGGGNFQECFAWTGWSAQDTATEVLKTDAEARAKAKKEKQEAAEKAAHDARMAKEAADKEAERERVLLADRRAKTKAAEEEAIAAKRQKFADQRTQHDEKLAKKRKQEDADRERKKDQHKEEEKYAAKRRAKELASAESRLKEREKELRQGREDRARKMRRDREARNREQREKLSDLEKRFQKEAAARREKERERKKVF